MELRPYQQDCLIAVWNELSSKPTALVSLPTGSGKSIIIAALLEKSMGAKHDIKCLVLFNRVTLLSQLGEKFKEILGRDQVGIYCGTECEWDDTKSVTVGSIQSLVGEQTKYDLIIIDECHALNEDDGRYIGFIKKQMELNPRLKVVGFSATVFRIDGYIFGKNKFFTHPCYEKSIRFFINNGFLVPPIAKQPDHQIDLSKLRVLRGEYRQDDIDNQTLNVGMAKDQVIDALNRSMGRHKIIWCCSSIAHAELINKLLGEMGEKSGSVHSKMDFVSRDQVLGDFRVGPLRHLTFVTVIAEGFDQPSIDTVVLMRPTKSSGLMIQVCGRGLRPSEGKKDCLVLDYAGVIGELGPLEDPVIGRKPKGGGEAPKQKTCPQCRSYVPPRVMKCPDCGFDWPKLDAAKLALTADENASLMKKYIKTLEIRSVKMSLHISKAGNKCIKLEYVPKAMFAQDSVQEFFTIGADFSMRKFVLRAIDLGFDLKEKPEEQCVQRITKIPKYVDYVLENKYPRIQKLRFV